MLVQVRGTSGSGKSTVVRRFMELYGPGWKPAHTAGRRQPLFYESADRRVIVLGHYETPTGGCDTIGSAPDVYEVVRKLGDTGAHLVFEGLVLSEDVKWSLQMQGYPIAQLVRVIFLTTELDECFKRIAHRRAEAGKTEPVNPYKTTTRYAAIERVRQRLIEAGAYVRRFDSDQAPGVILNWIRS